MIFKYKHFYAKDESTHPSMVSTHQHRFKGKMCKNVETVSTHVKSVSTRVAVFQKSSLPRSTHYQSRSTLDPVSRTASLKNWDSRSTHSQSRSTLDPVPRTASLQIWDSRSTHSRAGRHGTFFPEQLLTYSGQCVDTTTMAGRHTTETFHPKVDGCHTPLKHSKEADPIEDSFGEEFEEDPTSQIAEHRLGLQASQAVSTHIVTRVDTLSVRSTHIVTRVDTPFLMC
ncbi:hypothetical protein Taro_034010 [Colocasia esculenta]|uniref:Uncharacterized protein n=1 Tax=Colocasia esculenta TaxID=4460 RepID=A0A843WE63_COLES|nr:hypothetical protein [Colocasia esculenta]